MVARSPSKQLYFATYFQPRSVATAGLSSRGGTARSPSKQLYFATYISQPRGSRFDRAFATYLSQRGGTKNPMAQDWHGS